MLNEEENLSRSRNAQLVRSLQARSRLRETLLSEKRKLKPFATGGLINTESHNEADVITVTEPLEGSGSPIMLSHFSEVVRPRIQISSSPTGSVTRKSQ